MKLITILDFIKMPHKHKFKAKKEKKRPYQKTKYRVVCPMCSLTMRTNLTKKEALEKAKELNKSRWAE